MLSVAAGAKVYLAAEPVDLRRGHDGLCALVRGNFSLDPSRDISSFSSAGAEFRTQVLRTWLRALRRRGQRRCINWVAMGRIASRWGRLARAQHPLPEQRFDARTQGKSPVR